MTEKERIESILKILKNEYENWNAPIKNYIKNSGENPFETLVATILSSRTKDEVTAKVCRKLFEKVKTPNDLLKYKDELENLLYPVGFYRKKAMLLVKLGEKLKEKFDSKVPSSLEELITLPGVGRKTANIVLQRVFNKSVIAVDTHVHRISNRTGIVETRRVIDTEKELSKKIPQEWKSEYNKLFVAFGQTICKPSKPECEKCPINHLCPKRI